MTTPAPRQIWRATRRANRYVLIRSVDERYAYAVACGPRDGTGDEPDVRRSTRISRTPTGLADYVLHMENAPAAPALNGMR